MTSYLAYSCAKKLTELHLSWYMSCMPKEQSLSSTIFEPDNCRSTKRFYIFLWSFDTSIYPLANFEPPCPPFENAIILLADWTTIYGAPFDNFVNFFVGTIASFLFNNDPWPGASFPITICISQWPILACGWAWIILVRIRSHRKAIVLLQLYYPFLYLAYHSISCKQSNLINPCPGWTILSDGS